MPAKKKETIRFKTATGSVHIERTETVATITQDVTAFGYKEHTVSTITRLDESCIHYAFGSEQQIKDVLKNA